jgi:hypothetical protein
MLRHFDADSPVERVLMRSVCPSSTFRDPKSQAQKSNLVKRSNPESTIAQGGPQFLFTKNGNCDPLSLSRLDNEGRFAIVTNVGSGMRWTRAVRKTGVLKAPS